MNARKKMVWLAVAAAAIANLALAPVASATPPDEEYGRACKGIQMGAGGPIVIGCVDWFFETCGGQCD